MKQLSALALALVLAVTCLGTMACGAEVDATKIQLSDSKITVDGAAISTDSDQAVYAAHDIVYYEDGKDFTYGEGTEADAHSQEEAQAHTVVHITQPGTYSLSGTLSAGQIAVDLGEDAAEDPSAVVTLILDGVDITCTVAPAVIFYNVYECGSTDLETASETVDTSAAGANVIIADGTTNQINGSYVARIYKSYTLSEDGTEVVDSKKLHKYDGAFYSKMSMNVDGREKGNGVLNIQAENEGLDTELHLTINGGEIHITSGNDGINTNEDGVSVTTINGGTLTINVDGATGEGDGIDSNGYLVINGGTVTTAACADSMDSGLDADKGIYINGGTVTASGNMYDQIDGGGQNYAVFSFTSRQSGGVTYTLLDGDDQTAGEWTPANDFTYLVVSSPDLTAGSYTLWGGGSQLACSTTSTMGGMGGPGIGGMEPGQRPEGQEMPEGQTPPDGMTPPESQTPPQDMERPEDMTPPDGATPPDDLGQRPEGPGSRPGTGMDASGVMTKVFVVEGGGTFFTGITDEIQGASDLPFSDVSPEDWCYEQIRQLYTLGVLNGTDTHTFSPDGTLTRAQAVVLLYRCAGSPESGEEVTFSDVAQDAWCADAVAWAVENGLVTGYEDNTFAPNAVITRQQLAVLLYRCAGSPESDSVILAEYNDGKAVAEYAVSAVSWALETGIHTGTDTATISPEGTATRAQTAVILGRYLSQLNQENADASV